MFSPGCISCQDRLSCSDSPLSVTGNIIGILTFAGAIFISIQVYVNTIMNAERNVNETLAIIHMHFDEADRLTLRLGKYESRMDRDQIHRFHTAQRRIVDDMTEFLGVHRKLFFTPTNGGMPHWNRFWEFRRRRTKLAVRGLIQQCLEKMEKTIEVLRRVVNDILLQLEREAADHDIDFRKEVLAALRQLQDEVRILKENNPRSSRQGGNAGAVKIDQGVEEEIAVER